MHALHWITVKLSGYNFDRFKLPAEANNSKFCWSVVVRPAPLLEVIHIKGRQAVVDVPSQGSISPRVEIYQLRDEIRSPADNERLEKNFKFSTSNSLKFIFLYLRYYYRRNDSFVCLYTSCGTCYRKLQILNYKVKLWNCHSGSCPMFQQTLVSCYHHSPPPHSKRYLLKIKFYCLCHSPILTI